MPEPIPQYNIMVLGAAGVGKTSLIMQFIYNVFVTICDPVVEDSYRQRFVIDGERCLLDVCDTPAARTSTAYTSSLEEVDAFVLVYNICSRPSFESIREQHAALLKYRSDLDQPDSDSTQDRLTCPIVLFGNKVDRPAERHVSAAEGRALVEELRAAGFAEVSSKDFEKTRDAFFNVVREIKRRKPRRRRGILNVFAVGADHGPKRKQPKSRSCGLLTLCRR